MIAILALAGLAYLGEIAVDAWLTRKWKRLRDDACELLADASRRHDACEERNAETDRLLDKVNRNLQIVGAWNQLTADRQERWVTMSADEKERHLASERAVWAAAHAALIEEP